jgi:hypothetical protein
VRHWTLAAVACTIAVLIIVAGRSDAADCVTVSPGADLPDLADNRPAGTCFLVRNGTYTIDRTIDLDSGDSWQDASPADERPLITTTTAVNIMRGQGAERVFVGHIHLNGARSADYCEDTAPYCGRGISEAGPDLTVAGALLTNHVNSGIGGSGDNLVVRNTTIRNVGSREFSRYDPPSESACVKSVNSLRVENSRCFAAYWNGFWCDGGCKVMTVLDSEVVRYGHVGIQDEIADGPAEIRRNKVHHGGLLPAPRASNPNAGIKIISSTHVLVRANTLYENAGLGIMVMPSSPRHATGDVWIEANNLIGREPLRGCDIEGVVCRDNR